MAKAGHANTYKQLSLSEKDWLSAVATLRGPSQNAWYGFFLETQLFGLAAAVLNCNCFLEVPCMGNYGDYAAALPG